MFGSDSQFGMSSSCAYGVQNDKTPSGLPYKGPVSHPDLPPMTSDVREKPAFQSYPVSGFSLTYNNTQRFDINNWVQVLTGCTEDSLLRPEVRREVFKLKEMVDVPGLSRKAPHLVLQNIATSAESDAGHMVLASIKELQAAARAVAAQDPSPVKKPKIIIDIRLDEVCQIPFFFFAVSFCFVLF